MDRKQELLKEFINIAKVYGLENRVFSKEKEDQYSLGISLYPEKSSEEEILSYIEKAREAGFNHVFTNMLSIEGPDDPTIKKMLVPLKKANSLGYDVIVDVSPKIFSNLNMKPDSKEFQNLLKSIGGTGARFDLDYGGKVEARTSKVMKVEINASTLDVSAAKAFIKNGGDVSRLTACHNFYPQEYTGLSESFFRKTSQNFKDLGIRVSAFCTLNPNKKTIGAWEENDGMPTLENHRYESLSYQVRWLYATGIVDQVIISAQYPTKDELKDLKKITLGAINLVINTFSGISNVEKEILFSVPHQMRGEIGNDLAVRCAWPRILFKNHSIKPRKTSRGFFDKGDVVILNDRCGRYKGELQIIKSNNIKNDGKRNLIGTLTSKEMELIKEENIFNWRPVRFIED